MKVAIPLVAAPGNTATIVLFTTHQKVAGNTALVGLGPSVPSLVPAQLVALEFVWILNDQASAVNGVRVWVLSDSNVWRETDVKDYTTGAATIGAAAPKQVPVLAAGQEYSLLIDVARYRGVSVEYTAGATGSTPTTGWDGIFTAHIDVESVIR